MKYTAEIDGKQVELDLPDDQFYTVQQVNDDFIPKSSLGKRLEQATRAAHKKLADRLMDPEQRDATLSELGVEIPAPSGDKPDAIAAAIEKARAEWDRKELQPLRADLEGKVETLTGQVGTLQRRRLHAEIVQAAATAGVKPALLKAPRPGAPPAIVTMTEAAFALDPETDGFYMREGDGFAMANTPSKTRMFKDVAEFVTDWAEDKDNAEFVTDRRQRGPGVSNQGPAAGSVTLTREQASDHATYQEALQKVGGDHSKIQIAA